MNVGENLDRREIERMLIVPAVDQGSLDFLTQDGITAGYFAKYRKLAKKIWAAGELDGYLPTVEVVKDWDEARGISDWEPNPENVKYAVHELRNRHAESELNKRTLQHLRDPSAGG
jgi:hypothetical protein